MVSSVVLCFMFKVGIVVVIIRKGKISGRVFFGNEYNIGFRVDVKFLLLTDNII